MRNACEKWKDQLLEAALTGATTAELAAHLRTCTHCAEELKALEPRKARLDALLPQIVQGSKPSADFGTRVLVAAQAGSERKHASPWRTWTLAGAVAATAIALLVGALWYRGRTGRIQPEELAAAQRLAEWRAPSDSLLATPGQEILRTTPKLGESYLNIPVNKVEEEER